MNAKKDHLPLFGAGPFYVITISIFTFSALILHYVGCIPSGQLPGWALVLGKVLGGFMLAEGIAVWCFAVFGSKLTKSIKENHLITDGVYSIVRHPVYSAFTVAEWGLLLWTGNMWLLVLIPVYWLFFSVLMKNTEEKWLRERYGQEYEAYCKRVNRCIPWWPRRGVK